MKKNLGKVGTELSKLIPAWAVAKKRGCSCKDMARKMDTWGIDLCVQRRELIIKHLVGQSDLLIPMLKAVPDSMKKVVATQLLGRSVKAARIALALEEDEAKIKEDSNNP